MKSHYSAPAASARSTPATSRGSPASRLKYVVDVNARRRRRARVAARREGRDRRRGVGRQGDRRRRHRLEHRHACRPHRCAPRRPARRSSAKSRSISIWRARAACAEAVKRAGVDLPDRLPAPLRSDVRRAEGAPRRRRDRRTGNAGRHQPRSRRAAGRLHQGLGRHLQGHADPRLRHLPLDPRRRGRHRLRDRQLPDRSGDRSGRRHRFDGGDHTHAAAAGSRRSTPAAAPPTATTSASRCSAARACCRPATTGRPKSLRTPP